MERRTFLTQLGGTVCAAFTRRIGLPSRPENPKADVTIRISPVEIEVAPKKIIKTTGYNGSVPGPILRLREGQPITMDVFKETKIPELVHWHGLLVPSDVDGAEEEGTPMVPPVRNSAIFTRSASSRKPLVSQPYSRRPRHEARDLHGPIRISLRGTERRTRPI